MTCGPFSKVVYTIHRPSGERLGSISGNGPATNGETCERSVRSRSLISGMEVGGSSTNTSPFPSGVHALGQIRFRLRTNDSGAVLPSIGCHMMCRSSSRRAEYANRFPSTDHSGVPSKPVLVSRLNDPVANSKIHTSLRGPSATSTASRLPSGDSDGYWNARFGVGSVSILP